MKKGKIIISAALIAALLFTTAVSFGAAKYYYGDVNPGPGPAADLAAPKVTAKATGLTSVQLSWKAVKGAKGYVIYRSKGMFNTNFKRIKTLNGSQVRYTDKNCTNGGYYNYEVFAYKYKNGKRVYSQRASAKMTAGIMKPYASAWPESLTAVSVYGRSSFADKLVFYKSASEDGPFETLGEGKVSEGSYLDEAVSFGQTWYYKVKAYRKIGAKIYTSVSDAAEVKVHNPKLEISVTDLNYPEGGLRDTFVYKLTSDIHNGPAVIYRDGMYESTDPYDYSYNGEKSTEHSSWKSSVSVVLDSYSFDGAHYVKMEEGLVLKPGETVYLKFTAKDKAVYYREGFVSLDIGYYSDGSRVKAGCLWLEKDGRSHYSYDY